MGYLFSQTFIWLLLAFLFGLFMGWLLRGIMCRDEEVSDSGSQQMVTAAAASTGAVAASSVSEPVAVVSEAKVETVEQSVISTETADITDDMRPASLAAPNGEADDLKRIKGVGPVIQNTLNELGVYHFQQIAEFSADNVAWVDNHISFPGRIEREGWIGQAADLVKGVKTEFSKRYDRGEVGEKNPNRKA